MQQKSKFRFYGKRDETINHIMNECSKLAEKEHESRHDWVRKVIFLELCKKLKLDDTTKSYMRNQNPSWRMRRKKFSGILKYKRFT